MKKMEDMKQSDQVKEQENIQVKMLELISN